MYKRCSIESATLNGAFLFFCNREWVLKNMLWETDIIMFAAEIVITFLLSTECGEFDSRWKLIVILSAGLYQMQC